MYRLVLYYLVALVGTAFMFGFIKLVPHDPTALAFTTILALVVCWITNRTFARIFGVPANSKSVYITALILALILDPVMASDLKGVGAVIFASVWAIASKFIFAIGRKHLFNPAAFGVALSALLLDQPATWWVGGSLPLLPVVLVGGALVARKLRRFDLVGTFVLAALGTVLTTVDPSQYVTVLTQTLGSSPLLFFAFVMLTEPLTAPTARWSRIVFAALVGFLFAPNIHVGTFYFTPEAALLAGNLFAYMVSPKGRFVLTLERIEQSAADSYDFIFRSPRKLAFQAGQYLEWTIGLDHPDNRGNRRYFTVASAPTEGCRSSRRQILSCVQRLQAGAWRDAPGDTIHASQLAGDFTLPANPETKLAFLAGGIGITPFRSMLQYLLDRKERGRSSSSTAPKPAGHRLSRRTRRRTARTRHQDDTCRARGSERGQYAGFIDERLVRAAIPDYLERTFYISGPQAMVKALREIGCGRWAFAVQDKGGLFSGLFLRRLG